MLVSGSGCLTRLCKWITKGSISQAERREVIIQRIPLDTDGLGLGQKPCVSCIMNQ